MSIFLRAGGGYLVTKLADAVIAASTAEANIRKKTDAKVSLAVRDREVVLSIAY